MTQYELILLLKEETDLKTIKELMDSLKIKVHTENIWGRKTLTYPIKKQLSAFFYHYLIEMNPTHSSDFKRKLTFEEKVMRYLLLQIPSE